jgi:hypothetical protein
VTLDAAVSYRLHPSLDDRHQSFLRGGFGQPLRPARGVSR